MSHIRKIETRTRGVRWRAEVFVAPHKPVSRHFDRREEARVWAGTQEKHLKATRHSPDINAEFVLFPDLVRRFSETLPDPRSDYHNSLLKSLAYWAEEIGAVPLSHVTPQLLAQARDRLCGRHHRRMKASTVNKHISHLNILFNVAMKEWGILSRNPLACVKRQKIPQKCERFLTPEETERLLRACRRCTLHPLYLIVLLALATGARKKEILSLRWDHIDLKTGDARLPKTKGKKPRTIHISGTALFELQRMAEENGLRGYVFRTRRTHRQFVSIDVQWRKAREDAGIEKFRFHDLRHTFASWMAKDGANLLDIKDALGHSTVKQTERYAHLTKSHIRGRVSETVNNHLNIEGIT